MGNKKFKLSNMIPNAWFYKLKDMSSRSRMRKRNNNNNKATSPTKSHYYSIEPNISGKYYNSQIYTKHTNIVFSDSSPTRRSSSSSSKKRANRKTIYKPSPTTTIVSSPVLESWINPNYHVKSQQNNCDDDDDCVSNFQESVSSDELVDNNGVISSECSCCRVSSSTNDIIIDMKSESFAGKTKSLGEFSTDSKLNLAPILTKPVKFDDKFIEANELRNSTKLSKLNERIRAPKERKTSPIARKSSANNSTGIKLRINSPKFASRKIQAYARRSSSVSSNAGKCSKSTGFPEGFAVVKSSVEPQKDFRNSMIEMIKENNIRASKDLENLLACYLQLNSSEYHDIIVKAFEQIWYDMALLKL